MAFPLHSKVALKNGFDHLYPKIWIGAPGWIRAQREDSYGFEEILIEWDHDSWLYNGAPNGWALAEHFDMIEEPSQEVVPKKKKKPELSPEIEEYVKALQEGFEGAAGAEGFLLITAKSSQEDGHDLLGLDVFSFAHTPEAQLVLKLALLDVATQSYSELSQYFLEDDNEEI